MNDLRRQPSWHWQEHFISCGALLLLVVALWLPFGFHGTGLVEDWSFYLSLDQQSLFEATAGNFNNQPNRPFFLLAWWAGHFLTPDSFVGLNLVMILLLWGKAALLYSIIRRLMPSQVELAFFSGLLLVLFPADRGILCLRVINYHVSVVFFLLSVRLLLAHWFGPRWYLIAATLVAQLICLGTVEVAIPLMLASPLLLVMLDGGITRKVIRVSIWWCVIPLLMVAATLYVVTQGSSYGTALMDGSAGTREPWVALLTQLFGRAYGRHFIYGWLEIFRNSLSMPRTVPAVVGGIVLVAGLVAWYLSVRGRRSGGNVPSLRTCLVCLATGLLVIALGYAVFIPIPTHRMYIERVFLHSSVGGAICCTAVLWLLCRRLPWARLAFALPALALTGLAAWGTMGQQREMQQYSLMEQQLLAGITRNVADEARGKLILVVGDTSPFFGNILTFGLSVTQHHFQDALKYLYQDASPMAVVVPPGLNWASFGGEKLVYRKDGVDLIQGARDDGQFYPYENIIVLNRERNGDLARLDVLPAEFADVGADVSAPLAKLTGSGRFPPRVHTLFARWPFQMPQYPVKFRRHFRLEFDQPVDGSGWAEPEGTLTWTSAPVSSLHLPLARDTQYNLTFRLSAALTPENLTSLSVWVNGERLKLKIKRQEFGAAECRALISRAVVRRNEGPALVEFRVGQVHTPKSLNMSNDERTLGVQFDWLTIEPREKSD